MTLEEKIQKKLKELKQELKTTISQLDRISISAQINVLYEILAEDDETENIILG